MNGGYRKKKQQGRAKQHGVRIMITLGLFISDLVLDVVFYGEAAVTCLVVALVWRYWHRAKWPHDTARRQ